MYFPVLPVAPINRIVFSSKVIRGQKIMPQISTFKNWE
jgi:hypothetical protein